MGQELPGAHLLARVGGTVGLKPSFSFHNALAKESPCHTHLAAWPVGHPLSVLPSPGPSFLPQPPAAASPELGFGGGFCIRLFPQEGEQGPDDRWAGAGFGGPRSESGARRHVWVCKQAEVSPGGKVHGKKRART